MVFDEQFGVALDVMAAALKGGSTFMNGLKFVSESMDPPIGQEFGKISSELALGVDIPTALERFRERIASKNVFLFVIAVKVANQTGAALAPTFVTLARVIGERFRLQGLINISISENIAGILVLGVAPWLIIPILAMSCRDIYSEFLATIWGQILTCFLFIYYLKLVQICSLWNTVILL